MNRLPSTGLMVVLLLLSSGCTTINDMITETIEESRLCTEITPHIYCQDEALEKTPNPISPSTLWESVSKGRKTADKEKSNAWITCGGMRFEISGIKSSVNQENEPITDSQQIYYLQRCMLDRGFRYTGGCNDEIPVACQSLK